MEDFYEFTICSFTVCLILIIVKGTLSFVTIKNQDLYVLDTFFEDGGTC